jgi:hypothetical protein
LIGDKYRSRYRNLQVRKGGLPPLALITLNSNHRKKRFKKREHLNRLEPGAAAGVNHPS